jgi:hypothetical protein
VVGRIAQISRQAIYRTPKTPPSAARRLRPPADEVEQAIVGVAADNHTDGYRNDHCPGGPQAGPRGEPQTGAAGDARAPPHPASTALDGRRRPGFSRVTRPNEL